MLFKIFSRRKFNNITKFELRGVLSIELGNGWKSEKSQDHIYDFVNDEITGVLQFSILNQKDKNETKDTIEDVLRVIQTEQQHAKIINSNGRLYVAYALTYTDIETTSTFWITTKNGYLLTASLTFPLHIGQTIQNAYWHKVNNILGTLNWEN